MTKNTQLFPDADPARIQRYMGDAKPPMWVRRCPHEYWDSGWYVDTEAKLAAKLSAAETQIL